MNAKAKKIRIGILFGGRSAEHEVSLVSATSIMNALDRSRYEVVPIGISAEGRWLSTPDALQLIKDRVSIEQLPEHVLLPDPRKQALVEIDDSPAPSKAHRLDVIFPVMHGTYGEDGAIQGLLELADIPYVGAGILGSAVGMDKVIQKQLLEQAGIRVSKYLWFRKEEVTLRSRQIVAAVEKSIGYPCFVKPANTGSSVGITKAHHRKELLSALSLAGEFDLKVIVEKNVANAREVECSVLGNHDPIASVPGEILSSNEFYDYDAKYVDGKSTSIIPASLPKGVASRIQAMALKVFNILDCSGMARVDFFVQRKTNTIHVNEINTIPGFTSISMYPKLWEATGLSYSDLLDRLIELAFERHRSVKALRRHYEPKKAWYKE